MQLTPKENKRLVEKYPFLLLRDWLTGEVPDNYDYSYTKLDDMPDGWRIAFGEQMCEEILDELIFADCLDKYRVVQIKEKFGSLRWYDNNCIENVRAAFKIYNDILPRYQVVSAHTCIRCGKQATRITYGWISPYCDDCVPYESMPIKEYYEECIDELKN